MPPARIRAVVFAHLRSSRRNSTGRRHHEQDIARDCRCGCSAAARRGTEAADVPDEVLNKILNAHPGVQMVNLRAFSPDDAAAVLAYAATLPVK
jgi:hypothetical protein